MPKRAIIIIGRKFKVLKTKSSNSKQSKYQFEQTTSFVSQNVNPKWNEIFYIPVANKSESGSAVRNSFAHVP